MEVATVKPEPKKNHLCQTILSLTDCSTLEAAIATIGLLCRMKLYQSPPHLTLVTHLWTGQ